MNSKISKTPKETRPIAKYANYLEIGHNAYEIILDFGQFHIEDEDPKFVVRIVTNPPYLKAFQDLILRSIENYEHGYGVIREEGKQECHITLAKPRGSH